MSEDDPGAWRLRAACRGVGVDMFFAEPTGTGRGRVYDYRAAEEYCATCPVTAECLEEALSLPPPQREHGYWGGLSPVQRRGLRRRKVEPLDEVG